jgi:hypothetical protein
MMGRRWTSYWNAKDLHLNLEGARVINQRIGDNRIYGLEQRKTKMLAKQPAVAKIHSQVGNGQIEPHLLLFDRMIRGGQLMYTQRSYTL